MGKIVTSFRRGLRRAQPLTLNTRIALERVLAGLTQPHCARAMGWHHKQWQRVEDGLREVKPHELAKIAEVLGVTEVRLRGDQAMMTPGFKTRGRPRLELAA